MTEMTAWANSFAAAQRAPEELVPWVDRATSAVLAGVPETTDPDLADLVRRAVEQHWLAFLDWMFSEEPFELVPAAAEAAVELARRHHGLPTLLRIYRIAQEASWEFAIDVVHHAPQELDHEALLVWFWSRAGAWFNASIDASVLLHQAEATRIQQRGDAQRFETVARLLDDPSAMDPTAVSAALGGHPLTGPHVALVAHALTSDALALLEPTLHRLARHRGRSLLVRPGGREVWMWLPAPPQPVAIDPSIRVTVGGPAPGLDGFVAAHRDAVAAQRVALHDRRARTLTAYDDVAALALLRLDPPTAERFTRRVLGHLAEPGSAILRETARVVLTTPGGSAAVSGRLGVHPNTVRYRLGQLERILGGPLVERTGDLLLALDYFDAFLA